MTIYELCGVLAANAQAAAPNGALLRAHPATIGKIASDVLNVALGTDSTVHAALELSTISFDRETEKSSGEISWWFLLDGDLAHFTFRIRSKSDPSEYSTTAKFHPLDHRTSVELHFGQSSARLIIDNSLTLEASDAHTVPALLGFFNAVQSIRGRAAA